jgi:phosphoribosyl-ATP pyrophosphohydrolase
MADVLDELAAVLDERRKADPDESYAASLYSRGTDAILKKIGEEATEVVMAGKSGDSQALVREIADLWFHTLVLLVHNGLSPEQVRAELRMRFGRSGLDEKAARLRE